MLNIRSAQIVCFIAALIATVTLAGTRSSAETVTAQAGGLSYPIVDTNQTHCFSTFAAIACGSQRDGQDAQYAGLQPAYQDNGDGTITDLNTGLMWIADPGDKTDYNAARSTLQNFSFAGYDDWRLPSIKELYSLTMWNGIDASRAESSAVDGLIPLIDTDYFRFYYGDEVGSPRVIDSQWLTDTIYNSTVMGGSECFFGFNFADGRIKCYPLRVGNAGGYFALFVRGNPDYGINAFVDNGDGTVSDTATGLMWQQADNGAGTIWGEALAYCENLSLAGYDDWRLPNIKELHSIVDYSRSPDATNSAALDPIFSISGITNEAGQPDYPFFWSSTTLISYPDSVMDATYVSFGRATGYMEEFGAWIDVHGAGAQRSDFKDALRETQEAGFGPQGDSRRSDNYVRCVRAGDVVRVAGDDPSSLILPEGTTSFAAPDAPTSANESSQDTAGTPSGQPPQPAIDACTGQSVGAACSFMTPNGEVSGTCADDSGVLACRPAR